MLRQRWNQWLDNLGLRVSGLDALPQLSMLAIPVGLLSGGVIVLFRLLIESSQVSFLPGGNAESYEALPPVLRFVLPVAGGLLLGLLWTALGTSAREVGITHVMERLAYHQGRLPFRNALAQFIGAALSIISGHSVGREGPSVHLGAASGSQLGQWLRLPNNSNRTLVACGIAAAIAASFNTPLAGVIFAMEVVMMEYSLTSFAPVILSAVTATTLTRVVFGDMPVFDIPPMQLGSLMELPYVVLMGIVIGTLAAMFIHVLQRVTTRVSDWLVWVRFTLAGMCVGLVALAVPEVMGIGYDTVNHALLGKLGVLLLMTVSIAKLLATAIGLGLGLPGGLIGPTIVIGATAGGAMSILADAWLPGDIASPAFYALIGLGTMMGATLQAPLAALTAMLELTANPNIILPGMLALITAGLVSREIFGMDSVYLVLMRARGLDYRHNPLTQTLHRVGVASVMERHIATLPDTTNYTDATAVLSAEPKWILATVDNQPTWIMPAADLARYLQENEIEGPLVLAEIPAERHEVTAIDFNATLLEALTVLDKVNMEAAYVVRSTVPGIDRIYGVLTRSDIERSYSIK
ncbi:MAG: chloride channel protein [Pseudomonadota bacterium]